MAGYILLEFGNREDYPRGFTIAMRDRFAALSDAHVVWAVFAQRSDVLQTAEMENAYRIAAKVGVPIFATGLVWLANACEGILGNRLSLTSGAEAQMRTAIMCRAALVPGQYLTVLDAGTILPYIALRRATIDS